MKAKEYYEKYKDAATYHKLNKEKELMKICKDIVAEMTAEVFELSYKRHVSTPEGLLSILKEQQGKWMAITRIFIKKDGFTPFKENAFKMLMLDKAPELKKDWR